MALSLLLAECGGGAFGAGAADDSGPPDAPSSRDGAPTTDADPADGGAQDGASSPRVAFCATLSGITDGGPPAVYGCGKGWESFIDAGLVVPDAAFAIETFDGVNSSGQQNPAGTCDSWKDLPFDCPQDAGGLVTDCEIQLPAGQQGFVLYGHCVTSPLPPYGFGGW